MKFGAKLHQGQSQSICHHSLSPFLQCYPSLQADSALCPHATHSEVIAHLQTSSLCQGRFSALTPTGLKTEGGLQLSRVGAKYTFKSSDERTRHLEHSWTSGPRVTVSSATAKGQTRRQRGARHPPPPLKWERSRAYAQSRKSPIVVGLCV